MKKIIVLLIGVISPLLAQEYSFKLFTGKDVQAIVPFIAQQRVSEFREYPYLYEGNIAEDTEHCQWFAQLPHSAVAVAYLAGKPVGFISSTSFADFDVHFKGSIALFENNGLDPHNFIYIPEAIIMPEHRGKSLTEKLHALIEKHAKSLGYKGICFAEESHDKHPLKPATYKGLEGLFLRAGYTKTQMIIKFPWLTIQPDGSLKDEDHELCYWIKNL